MSTSTLLGKYVARLTLSTAAVFISAAVVRTQAPSSTPAAGPGAPGASLQRLASAARTADLRGKWDDLATAHDAIARLPVPATGAAWIDYYLGYVDWRRSSLAFMGEGKIGTVALLRHAAAHLLRALEAVPGFTEARLLLVIVDGGTITSDPETAAALVPRLTANAGTVFTQAPDNPRVKFLRAFMAFYRPGSTREGKDAALTAWRKAAEAFPRTAPANEPAWGRAEAWAWLGGTLLVDGKPAQAKDALEHAIAERKDFWWARDIALPQASRSRMSHASEH
jgi:hypothetical protein